MTLRKRDPAIFPGSLGVSADCYFERPEASSALVEKRGTGKETISRFRPSKISGSGSAGFPCSERACPRFDRLSWFVCVVSGHLCQNLSWRVWHGGCRCVLGIIFKMFSSTLRRSHGLQGRFWMGFMPPEYSGAEKLDRKPLWKARFCCWRYCYRISLIPGVRGFAYRVIDMDMLI